MAEARFVLSKKNLLEQVETLKNLGLKISYSYKTNREVGNVLQELSDVDFSIHDSSEIDMIDDKRKIWFFTQAESPEELKQILKRGVRNFVVDNEVDLKTLLKVAEGYEINLSLRMKFSEHRIGTGRYFVYGMPSGKVNELIKGLHGNECISRLGVHIHRKSQNVSEWEITEELKDSLGDNLEKVDFINLGGGLPSVYKSYTSKVLPYIFEKLGNAREFLERNHVETFIEPGRFLAAPCIRLETGIIQVYDRHIVINTTIYNCALDTVLTNTKMLVEGELGDDEDGDYFLIKGNSPTRDDIFRYKVKLRNPQVGDKIVFLNAGAYNYTTDFFGYKKLETEVVD